MDAADEKLFEQRRRDDPPVGDSRSLKALCSALSAPAGYSCLHIGSNLTESVELLLTDPVCRDIVSIGPSGLGNHNGDVIWAGTDIEGLDPANITADVCIIDADGLDRDAIRFARFCRDVLRDRGVVVFAGRTRVSRAIVQFLGELPHSRGYPLAYDLFVVELNIPSLLSDPGVEAEVPRSAWLVLDRLRVTGLAVKLGIVLAPPFRAIEWLFWRLALPLAAPSRRPRRPLPVSEPRGDQSFAVHTFVTDEDMYERMRASFIAAGFNPGVFIRHTDVSEDPYRAITRIAEEATANYSILCHQDVRADQGAGAENLLRALRELDHADPRWMVAGNAGVTRDGCCVRRLLDPGGGSTGEPLPLPVVTLDENFLVLNSTNPPRCSDELSGFHFYGSDVCLNALEHGGSAYVVDFPVTHLSCGARGAAYEDAKSRFADAWSRRYAFRYVITTTGPVFLSRFGVLRRMFGSQVAVACVDKARTRYTSADRLRRLAAGDPPRATGAQSRASNGIAPRSKRRLLSKPRN